MSAQIWVVMGYGDIDGSDYFSAAFSSEEKANAYVKVYSNRGNGFYVECHTPDSWQPTEKQRVRYRLK